FELYVQEGNQIKKDDSYIDSIINHPLHKIEYLYASVLRGEIREKIEGEKYGLHIIDVLIDEKGNTIKNFHMGMIFKKEEILFDLFENKEDLIQLNKKEINNQIFIPYIIKFRKIKNDELYLEDIRPL
ncbi:MAG: hypothetical protein K2X69_08710, partial [Silvanigrellaceae bacterium]|nr:hypothetical protein [Silvanigrellaceae bacterium]